MSIQTKSADHGFEAFAYITLGNADFKSSPGFWLFSDIARRKHQF